MKRILFFSLIFSFYLSAQNKTIFEKEYNKQYLYDKSTVLPNSNSIIRGYEIYDSNGNKKAIADFNFKSGFLVNSNSENSFFYLDRSLGPFKQKSMYFIDGKIIELSNPEAGNATISLFEKKKYFTSKYEYNLVNNKGKLKIKFLKDDIYLSVKDIVTRKLNTYKINKPSLDNYIGADFIKIKEDFRFDLVVNYDETIDLVSKSISKDYSNTILYKTRLSNEGKKVNELVYNLKVPGNFFLYSRNDGGKYNFGGSDNKFLHFADDLSINNYIEDVNNGDIYIYGIYGADSGKLNTMARPKGFYIFKFDKTGNKIWESINDIVDSDFNRNHVMNTIFVDLFQLNSSVCFTIRINGLKDFFNYNVIDKVSGKMVKSQVLEFSDTFAHLDDTDNNHFHINKIFKSLKELKKASFDFNGVVAYNFNPKIADYINNLKTDNEVFISADFTEKGIWLNESVENKYFKVTLFTE